MLMGEYHHNIDEKLRIIIPAKFRDEIGNECVITRGIDECLFVYSLSNWDKIVKKLETLPFTKKDARNFNRMFFSGATNCKFDKMGRVKLTNPLCSYASLNKECIIIGVSNRLEIWSIDKWMDYFLENKDNISSIADNLFSSEV